MPTDNDDRNDTLRLLVEMVTVARSASCWDDQRAEALLRNQSSASELRSLGVGEDLIEYLWPRS